MSRVALKPLQTAAKCLSHLNLPPLALLLPFLSFFVSFCLSFFFHFSPSTLHQEYLIDRITFLKELTDYLKVANIIEHFGSSLFLSRPLSHTLARILPAWRPFDKVTIGQPATAIPRWGCDAIMRCCADDAKHTRESYISIGFRLPSCGLARFARCRFHFYHESHLIPKRRTRRISSLSCSSTSIFCCAYCPLRHAPRLRVAYFSYSKRMLPTSKGHVPAEWIVTEKMTSPAPVILVGRGGLSAKGRADQSRPRP